MNCCKRIAAMMLPLCLGCVTPCGAQLVTPYQFMVGEPVLKYMKASAPEALPLLNGTKPWIILNSLDAPYPGEIAPPAWGAQYMIRFASEADLEAQFAAGKIPAYVTWIMYDNEPHASPVTPADELADPPKFYEKAAKLTHDHHLKFFATAGLSGDESEKSKIVALATQYDAYDLQTQTGESTVPEFSQKVRKQAARFKQQNANLIVAAGIGDFAHQELLDPAEIEPFLLSMPSGLPIWPNFGPHEPPGKHKIPGHFDYFVQVLKDTAKATTKPLLK